MTTRIIFLFFSFFLLNSPLLSKTIKGKVVEHPTNSPIRDAFILLADQQDRIHEFIRSDSLGFFQIENVTLEKFKIKTYRVGYVDIVTEMFDMSKKDTLNVIIRIEAAPLELEGVSITAQRKDRMLDAVGFYRRQKEGLGEFIQFDESDRSVFSNASDAFHRLPGVYMQPSKEGYKVYFLRYVRDEIEATILVDGFPWKSEYLNILNPADILGVEVYSSSINAPQEYGGGWRPGGMILIWTRK